MCGGFTPWSCLKTNGSRGALTTLKFSTPTNNRLRTSSNIRNQVVIHDGRVDIQTKNVGYGGNGNRNTGRQNKNQVVNEGNGQVQQIDESNQIVQYVPRTESDPRRANVQCYNCNARGHYARDCPKPKVHAAKYTREQMLLAMTDEIKGTLNDEENDFVLYNSYGDETLEELIVAVIMMARIQQADDNAETDPKYDVEAVSEVNASHIDLISGILSKVDQPKGTLVPRVQRTAADEVEAKRCWYLALNWYSRSQVNSAPCMEFQ
nr:hypothetical protein [Tanacetum cinerariifolium]